MVMGLLDDAEAESGVHYMRCGIALLDDDELIAEIDEALEAVGRSQVTCEGVARALAKRGVNIKAHTLRRHRTGGCTCVAP